MRKKSTRCYQWIGINDQGETISGELEAVNSALVKYQLQHQGVRPTRVQQKFTLPYKLKTGKIRPKEITAFTRQLSIMITAGIPLVQSINLIKRDNNTGALNKALNQISASIEDGSTLSEALSKHPHHFDELYVNMIFAGEQSGTLEILLNALAIYREKLQTLKAKIIKSLLYPAAIVFVGLSITAILLLFVVPQFETLFKSFSTELPPFTQFVIALSRFIQTKGWFLILFALGGYWIFSHQLTKSPVFANHIEKIVLELPLFGSLLKKAAIAKFCRSLSTIFGAGIPLLDALKTISGSTGSRFFQTAILEIRDKISEGQQLHNAIKNTFLFPPLVIQMVAIGEESGTLENALAKVASLYEEEIDNTVDSLTSLLEPLIMVILGILVGGLVIAMYLPIFQLGKIIT